MSTHNPIKNKIGQLKALYDKLRTGKDPLLQLLIETEIPESVYNSNAIENSTLTLRETEKILLEMELSRDINLREVFEAKNLARVTEYVRIKSTEEELSKAMILRLHQLLLGNIEDAIAGRFREKNEYVRVGTHIAPAPEHIERLIETILITYMSDHTLLTKLLDFTSTLKQSILLMMVMDVLVGLLLTTNCSGWGFRELLFVPKNKSRIIRRFRTIG